MILILMMALLVYSGSRSGEEINWQVISGGGSDGSSTNYQLNGTVAQTAVGSGTSTNYGLSHGYWVDFGGGSIRRGCEAKRTAA